MSLRVVIYEELFIIDTELSLFLSYCCVVCVVSGPEGSTARHVCETLGEVSVHQRRQSGHHLELLPRTDGHPLSAV